MSDNDLTPTFLPVPVPPAAALTGASEARDLSDVAELVRKRWGDRAIISVETTHRGDPFVVVAPAVIGVVLRALRDEPSFLCQRLETIAAVDLPSTGVEVVYIVSSLVHKHQFNLKIFLDAQSPRAPSVCDVFRAANWYERECYDMFGIVFDGHPNLKRILLPQDWVGHPLRREYVFPEDYNGMKVPL
jgi:NADH-quinone oxidoreductase subunit C